MNETLTIAIKQLADRSKDAAKPIDAMQFAQAVLSLTQAVGILVSAGYLKP